MHAVSSTASAPSSAACAIWSGSTKMSLATTGGPTRSPCKGAVHTCLSTTRFGEGCGSIGAAYSHPGVVIPSEYNRAKGAWIMYLSTAAQESATRRCQV
jgi:hypothetical protein